ncbi:sporulation protein [Sporosarcina sp. HYO08]|uniref:sporulation protein n=1 Tax=Sporosarcina sp. HYO08 TaxID=1759557 RepID=UPI0007921C9B|nr:sporulation protein [Sporosarcina sp. HYO08]KXH81755.1 hypothetical protein AU377_05680 [Sporosarcina sp. HYO08]
MVNSFSSSIEEGPIKVDTIVDAPNIAFGDYLSGKIYIEGPDSELRIQQIELELIKLPGQSMDRQEVISKQSFEMVSLIKSKETYMIPFELIPDERWETEVDDELWLRTTVYFKNSVQLQDHDQISYE